MLCRARTLFLSKRAAAITVQKHTRGWAQRQSFLRHRAAAVRVQATWRCGRARHAYLRLQRAAITLQVGTWRTSATEGQTKLGHDRHVCQVLCSLRLHGFKAWLQAPRLPLECSLRAVVLSAPAPA